MRHFQSLSEKFLDFLVTFFLRARSNLFLNVQWIILKKKNVLNRIFSWLTTFGVWAKMFCISDSNLPSGLSKWNSMCQWIFFTKQMILKKYILSQWFSVFGRQFSRFESRNFSQVYQSCIQFVWRKFSRESVAGNKLFLIVFLDFYAFLFSVKLRRFLLAVLSELNSTFPQDCLHGKPFHWKKISNYISICRPKFFGFMAKRFLHGCQNYLLCVQWNIPWRKVFWKTLFIYMRKLAETF